MSVLTKCDGCGKMEPDGTPRSQSDIKSVRLTVIKDERENFPGAVEKFESDLCDECEGILKFTYFGVKADGQLTIPAFIEPVSLRAIQ